MERKFLDRKFASRWVLFSEGDEGGMSMTGDILFTTITRHDVVVGVVLLSSSCAIVVCVVNGC